MFHPLFNVTELCFKKHLTQGTLKGLFTYMQTYIYKNVDTMHNAVYGSRVRRLFWSSSNR